MIDALPQRIARRIVVDEAGCWLWQGAATGSGYGQVWWAPRMQVVHRVTYQLLVGPIPEGLELDHLCEVKACCNPDHLEPVTHAENLRRCRYSRERTASNTCTKGHVYTPENAYAYYLRQKESA